MGMIMHDDVPYGEGTSYTQGTGIAINNNIIAVDADNAPTENSEKPIKSKGVSSAVKQIYADNGVLGAKNLIPYPYADKASTQNGVTYTYDEDGVVTANGTATATSWRTLEQNEFPNLKVGADYILSGCPQGGASDTYFLQLSYDNGTKFYKDTGNGVRFTNTGNLTRIQIIINSGITANNITFKPMLRLASDPDDTYVPYAMTNRELTETVDEFTASRAPVNGVVTFSDLNPDYGYKLFVDIPDETSSLPTNLTDLPVCKWTKVQRSTKADGTITLAYTVTNTNVNYCLRILK